MILDNGALQRLAWAVSEPAVGGRLLLSDGGAALAILPDGDALWMLLHNEGDTPSRIEARLRGAVAAVRGGRPHVAIVGGDPNLELAVVQAAAKIGSALAGVHRVAGGRVRTIVGSHFPPLEAAAAQLGASPPASELTAILLARQAVAAKEDEQSQAFVKHVSAGRPWVTWVLAGTCGLLFLLQTMWGDGGRLAALSMGAGQGLLLAQGEWWRVLAPAFLHGGTMHLAMNMLALLSFGPMLEILLGARRYLVLYFVSAVGASLTSAWMSPEVSSVGASGAIWGLMCAGLGLALRPGELMPPAIAARMKKQIWGLLGLNVAISFLPGIDMAGHFGGGAVGLALLATGLLTRNLRPHDRTTAPPRGLFVSALASLLVLAAVGSIGTAIAVGKPWAEVPPATSR